MKLALLLIGLSVSPAFAATYTVPVPEALAPFSQFSLRNARAKIIHKQLQVSYQLPAELVGTGTAPITFTGKVGDSFVNVSGTSVKGVCMVFAEKPVTCMLRYPKTVINEGSRATFLQDNFTGTDLLSREQVGVFFSNDPAGLLSISLP